MILTFLCYCLIVRAELVEQTVSLQLRLRQSAVAAQLASEWSLMDVTAQMRLVRIVAYIIVRALLAFIG